MLRPNRIAALVALASTAGVAGNRSARFSVGATVISSIRLSVAPAPADSATAESPGVSVRSVPVRGGVYRVTSLRVGATAYGASWAATLRAPDATGEPVRYSLAAGGAWDRKGFGAALPAGVERPVALASRAQAVEVAVFQPEAQRDAADRYVVLTVMVDAAPSRTR
jgi:hypothetical protein